MFRRHFNWGAEFIPVPCEVSEPLPATVLSILVIWSFIPEVFVSGNNHCFLVGLTCMQSLTNPFRTAIFSCSLYPALGLPLRPVPKRRILACVSPPRRPWSWQRYGLWPAQRLRGPRRRARAVTQTALPHRPWLCFVWKTRCTIKQCVSTSGVFCRSHANSAGRETLSRKGPVGKSPNIGLAFSWPRSG